MSDSEFECASVLSAVAPSKKSTKKPNKRKTTAVKQSQESSSPLQFEPGCGSSSAGGSKRKSSPPHEFNPTQKSKRRNLFNILQAEEAGYSEPKHLSDVASSFSSRVSTGTCRRTLKVSGDFFVDLKVYKTLDYVSNAADVRYKKALVTVKLQCTESSSPWEALQGFLGQAWTLFEDSEPTHYSDKINFK